MRISLALAVVCTVFAGPLQAADPAVTAHKLIGAGDLDPSTGGTVGTSFVGPVISSSGVISVLNYGPTASVFTFASPTAAPVLAARTAQFPGTSLPIYGPPQGFWMNNTGGFMEWVSVGSGPTGDQGLWTVSGGVPSLVAMISSTPPGVATPISSFRSVGYNDLGQFVFSGSPSTATNYVMSTIGGTFAPLAKPGDAVPGVAGKTFSSAGMPLLNNNGRVAVSGSYNESFGSANGIFLYSSAGGQLLANHGMSMPGYSAGSTFGPVYAGSINDADQVSFSCRMYGTTAGITSGIWRWSAGELQFVAGAAGAIPDRPGLAFNELYGGANAMNANGHIAFSGTVAGAGVTTDNDTAVFLATDTGVRTIYREGDQAPDLPDGVLWGPGNMTLPNFELNAADQVAFTVTLTGSGVTSSNNRALYLTDVDGLPHLIARTGSDWTVDGTSYGNISRIRVSFDPGWQNASPRALGPTGDLVFELTTGGKERIFAASVPEPACLGLLLLPMMALRRSRRA